MQKPIDIVLEDHGLLKEVDASQHAASSSGFGQSVGAQYERDCQLDRAVLSNGMRLVQLHHLDAASWCKHVQEAMQRVQQYPYSSFVYYSASKPESSRVPHVATPLTRNQ